MKSEDIYMKQQKTNWLEIKGCLPFNIICITVSDCKENWFQDTSKLTQDHRFAMTYLSNWQEYKMIQMNFCPALESSHVAYL